MMLLLPVRKILRRKLLRDPYDVFHERNKEVHLPKSVALISDVSFLFHLSFFPVSDSASVFLVHLDVSGSALVDSLCFSP